MGKILINKLAFDYGGKEVFENLNLELDTNWRIALGGKNGKGKSTLLKFIAENLEISRFRNILACFGVAEDIFYKKSSEFSEGEKKKIQLTKSMMSESSLLIWDEPLNFLDISTRRRLEEAILKYNPTLLFIEHDRYFVEKVATRVIKISSH